ncbi:protein phosphatase 2C domain-containing protein [Lysinibacter sp. HNR]|uniref:PP2C family protein-serine/threonine phosphatase n=1 Tax=Lysinibacter sp. HNR TaxID=3031408 RepID=UPI002434D22E|nr:protein phosphatase 2C domain-containing protein [Lysinibacter sp. HNR]WGD37982.1 protein phosphatase 2C domain-containing protein [Lysinibacter sp. HNR]
MNGVDDPYGSAEVAVGNTGVTLTLSWAAKTDVGLKRPQNEDSLVAHPPIFAVADGMGGHASGDVASAAVVAALGRITQVPVGPERIRAELENATRVIEAQAELTGAAGGSTCVGVAITERDGQPYWLVFNIGDSRVYVASPAGLRQLSVDHSVVQSLLDAGEISLEEAHTHPKRNVITRAIGFEASPVPDFWLIPAIPGESILCCSDGLTKELSNEEIALRFSSGMQPDVLVDRLVVDALALGGSDNISVIVVRVDAVHPASEEHLPPGSGTSKGVESEDWESTLPR